MKNKPPAKRNRWTWGKWNRFEKAKRLPW